MAKVDPKKKKATSRRNRSKRPDSTPKAKKTFKQRLSQRAQAAKKRQSDFLKRRPHRSFRLTRRRDYRRSLRLPGYWSLTAQVLGIMRKNWRLLFCLVITSATATFLLASIMTEEAYSQLKIIVDEASQEGELSGALPVLTVFFGVLTSQLTGTSSGGAGSSQQIFTVLVGLFTWLTVVWLLRSILAGQKPKMRDGLYSSGGPVIALSVLVLVLIIQLLPMAASIIVYEAANLSGLFDHTVMLMLFGGGVILLSTLSIYWATSTLIAMVIVALPGMYPLQAMKLSGDLVIGRRVRVLLRLVWSLFLILLFWAVVLIPVISIDGALKSAIPSISWLPLVPIVALLMTMSSIVFLASYIYVFYRKVVEDESAPA